MKKNNAIVIILVLVLIGLIGLWFWRRSAEPPVAIDLVELFPQAEHRAYLGERAFRVQMLEINGESRRAIFAHAPSRIIYKVTIPDDASLRVALGMSPDMWNREGDGVQFRIGISDGQQYDELFKQHVDPITREGERRWIPVTLDLSAYAGETVELIFNVDMGLGRSNDSRNDWAYWGQPELFVQR